MSSFHVDARINVKMEVELALRLGEMILASGTEDKQIRALGHMLSNIDKDEPVSPPDNKWIPPSEKHESSIVSEWQEPQQVRTSLGSMRQKVQNRKYVREEKWGVE